MALPARGDGVPYSQQWPPQLPLHPCFRLSPLILPGVFCLSVEIFTPQVSLGRRSLQVLWQSPFDSAWLLRP